MTVLVMLTLAQTGATLNPLIPIVAATLLLAGIVIFVISRLARRKGSHRTPVAKPAAASAVEPAELPPMGPGVDSPGSTLEP
jgi:LPXTG-motif cell wall-anchored protein